MFSTLTWLRQLFSPEHTISVMLPGRTTLATSIWELINLSLHITNGSVLKAYVTGKLADDKAVIAFNESMITGESSEQIFSHAFFQDRAKSLHVSFEQYAKITIAELDTLFHQSYSKMILWFDDDMFCQMNLLTFCAYLDSIRYKGLVVLNIIQRDFWQYSDLNDIIVKSYNLSVKGYLSLYQDVLVRKVFNSNYPVFEEMKEGIRLYANYVSDNSEIRTAIRAMIKEQKSMEDIVTAIIDRYPNYGIGDHNIKLLYSLEKCK